MRVRVLCGVGNSRIKWPSPATTNAKLRSGVGCMGFFLCVPSMCFTRCGKQVRNVIGGLSGLCLDLVGIRGELATGLSWHLVRVTQVVNCYGSREEGLPISTLKPGVNLGTPGSRSRIALRKSQPINPRPWINRTISCSDRNRLRAHG